MALTPEQISLIQKLHSDGAGYKSIAYQLGISRELVRYHCRKNDRPKKTVVLDSIATEDPLHCRFCKRLLKQPGTGRRRTFCSDQCRRSWWAAHAEMHIRNDTALYRITCKNCGTEFAVYGNRQRLFCCHDCYIQSRFHRGRSALEKDSQKQSAGSTLHT